MLSVDGVDDGLDYKEQRQTERLLLFEAGPTLTKLTRSYHAQLRSPKTRGSRCGTHVAEYGLPIVANDVSNDWSSTMLAHFIIYIISVANICN